jgi:hypothetical protein
MKGRTKRRTTEMKITIQLLESKGACSEQLSKFKKLFPDGVTPTRELCLAHAEDFDWGWAASKLLSKEGSEVFYKSTASVNKAYYEAEATARKAYYEAEAPARKAYKEATAPAEKAYYEAVVTARKANYEAEATAWFDIWQKEND